MSNLLLQDRPTGVDESLDRLGVQPGRVHTYPFSEGDVTAGSETELQAAVIGTAERVDLPLTLRQSNYFANVVRRAAAGDRSRRAIIRLEAHLESGPGEFWENSWVRIPMVRLGPFARHVLRGDLKADKTLPEGPDRSDAGRFFCQVEGQRRLRVPISYLIKLALADAVDGAHGVPGYCEREYRDPRPVAPGMFLRRGMPKSLFRPGSSTDVLLFQNGRIRFARDLLRNLSSGRVRSRFSQGFGRPLVEREVQVRSILGHPQIPGGGHDQ